MPSTMKAVQKVALGPGAACREVPVPSPGPGDVLIDVTRAAICGSDLHLYRWRAAEEGRGLTPPWTLGHEFCGQVVAVGPAVNRVKVGDRVAGETHASCGACPFCLSGDAHICPHQRNVGRTIDGCFARYILLP